MDLKCELCGFKNPKGAATGVVLRDNKLLMVRRREEPFKDTWDLPGGYMNGGESPEETIRREIPEELGLKAATVTFMRVVPGSASWKGQLFPVVSFFYLTELAGDTISLNEENSEYEWVALENLKPETIAYDSNRAFAAWLKENFTFDLDRVRELVRQLDSSASVNEYSLYRAVLNGFVSRRFDETGELIGMGWIFPRETLLRKQAVVEDMIVDEAYRGRGLGKALLDDLVRWARSNGVEMIELTSNPKRIAANGLYQKYGFQLHPTNHYLYKVG